MKYCWCVWAAEEKAIKGSNLMLDISFCKKSMSSKEVFSLPCWFHYYSWRKRYLYPTRINQRPSAGILLWNYSTNNIVLKMWWRQECGYKGRILNDSKVKFCNTYSTSLSFRSSGNLATRLCTVEGTRELCQHSANKWGRNSESEICSWS